MELPKFIIIPSLSCQASCNYCFGPHVGDTMSLETAKKVAPFIHKIIREIGANDISVIFHGGEPLLAPYETLFTLINNIAHEDTNHRVKFSIQSNLWALDSKIIELFKHFQFAVGTSIDGTKEICDVGRGFGYFEKTMASINELQKNGIQVGAIATLTAQTIDRILDIAHFYAKNNLFLTLHDAVKNLDEHFSEYAVNNKQYASAIKKLFQWYVDNSQQIKIFTLDSYINNLHNGQPVNCNFTDCLGLFLVIAPNGDIYHCQRFCGKKEYIMGNIHDNPSWTEILNSPFAEKLRQRQQEVKKQCGVCRFLQNCKGGCYYNALSFGNGVRDGKCEMYKEIFYFIEDNLHSRNVLQLAEKEHPCDLASNARKLLAVYYLAKYNTPSIAAQELYKDKICGDPPTTQQLLKYLQECLGTVQLDFNNLYLHVTYNCNLNCSHCFADADQKKEMTVHHFEEAVKKAVDLKFSDIRITGGEPTVHHLFKKLLSVCEQYRNKGTSIVLRTNFYRDFDEEDFLLIARSVDKIVVSIDGDEHTHGERRGKGAYEKTINNMLDYQRYTRRFPNSAELFINCVKSFATQNNELEESVEKLTIRLNIAPPRYKPLLPLGRSTKVTEPLICGGQLNQLNDEQLLSRGAFPLKTCGIGKNLYVEPNGNSYPCVAWRTPIAYIGNVFTDGLDHVLKSKQFATFARRSVDTIKQCKECEFRYLCGGGCRAWNNEEDEINAPPFNCEHLQERAKQLVQAARTFLKN